MKHTWIGFIATLISAFSLLPTVYTVICKKSTHSINYLYVVLGFIAQLIWFAYAFINKDWPVLTLAIYLMLVYISILFSKWYYEHTHQDILSKLKDKCHL